MKLNYFLSSFKKISKRSNFSLKSITKTIVVAIVLFVAVSYSSFSYSQNFETITSSDTGVDKIEISEPYPNPSTYYIQFDYRMLDKNSEGKITVYNLLGSVIGEYKLNSYDNRLSISVDRLKAGIYFYTISINNKSLLTKKFIVKH